MPQASRVDVVILNVVRGLENLGSLEAPHRPDELQLYFERECRGDTVGVYGVRVESLGLEPDHVSLGVGGVGAGG